MMSYKLSQERHKKKELPQEILVDIFSRLPAKSVGKCRCLAKSWRSLLSTSEFIQSHRSKRPHEETLVLVSPSSTIYSISNIGHHNVSRRLPLGDDWAEFVGSCDGLVLLLNWAEDRFLVNPTTLQQVQIQDSPLALLRDHSYRMHGFGYDSVNDDYKIVTLSFYDNEGTYEFDCLDTFVDVYSMKRGIWRRFGISPYNHTTCELCPGPFVNGAVHWFANGFEAEDSDPTCIAAFDLAHEVFSELPLPTDIDMGGFLSKKLGVLGGCLCMVLAQRNQMDVWIMKLYGIVDSWIKLSLPAAFDPWNLMKPLCFIDDNEDGDVVMMTNRRLVVCNKEEGMSRDMVLHGVQAVASAIDGGIFVEGLISPVFA